MCGFVFRIIFLVAEKSQETAIWVTRRYEHDLNESPGSWLAQGDETSPHCCHMSPRGRLCDNHATARPRGAAGWDGPRGRSAMPSTEHGQTPWTLRLRWAVLVRKTPCTPLNTDPGPTETGLGEDAHPDRKLRPGLFRAPPPPGPRSTRLLGSVSFHGN